MNQLLALRDLLSSHPLFALGIILVVGYALGKLATKLGLPEITGFILAGIILGESVTGIVPHHLDEGLTLVTETALGIIALTIGGEFYAAKLKRLGAAIVVITIAQIVLSFGAVALGLWVFGLPLPFALIMGAIATATAPAATVAIVQSLRAKGKFVDMLYGVVALDDAGAVIIFGVIFAVVSGIIGGGDAPAGELILHAFGEVGLSLLTGAISGFIMHHLLRKIRHQNQVLILTLGMLLVTTAIAIVFHLSPLLTNMAVGAVIINMSPENHRIFRVLEPFTPPIYALFFVIAGIELRPEILTQGSILILGSVYILARAAGKWGGVWLGALVSKTEPRIRNNLGTCMLPQAGVAIGLVLLVQASPIVEGLSPENAAFIDTMINIVLLSVFVNELAGPPLAKAAIIRGNNMEV